MIQTDKINIGKQKNVVISGGTSGFGRSLVHKFASNGHKVIFTSRSEQNTARVLNEFENNVNVIGIVSDMTSKYHVNDMYTMINKHHIDGVHIWINNAAISDNNTCILDHKSQDTIENIVYTNLTSLILMSKLAMHIFQEQDDMGHLFNVIGAGSDGNATPNFAVYGSTKAAVKQFTRSLRKELKGKQVGIHTLSPGMMPTPLLSKNASKQMLQVFNVLCEDPDKIVHDIMPSIMDTIKHNITKSDIQYMTLTRIVQRILSMNSRLGRFYPDH